MLTIVSNWQSLSDNSINSITIKISWSTKTFGLATVLDTHLTIASSCKIFILIFFDDGCCRAHIHTFVNDSWQVPNPIFANVTIRDMYNQILHSCDHCAIAQTYFALMCFYFYANSFICNVTLPTQIFVLIIFCDQEQNLIFKNTDT